MNTNTDYSNIVASHDYSLYAGMTQGEIEASIIAMCTELGYEFSDAAKLAAIIFEANNG